MKPLRQTKVFLWARNHKKTVSLILILIVITSIFVGRRLNKSSDELLTAPIQRGKIIEGVYGIGTVMTNRSFDLKTGVNSTISEIKVKAGDEVKKSQKLINLDGMIFGSPFDGVVTFCPFKVGENVLAGTTLISVMDFSDRYLVVSLEQEGALRVKKGQKAKLNFDSIRHLTFEGIVESVYSQGSNFLARIGISGLPRQILPGMTADVAIAISEHQNVLLVPIAALESGSVYVKKAFNRSEKIPVKTGITDGTMAEILSGDIKEGDRFQIRVK